jgi:asparagine synthase (glutamine-hydrolysing)
MSVLAGIWNLEGEPVDRGCLTRIGHNLEAYGPDGEFTYLDKALGMLYRPFHTTVESLSEHQPYVSITGKITTWDGRLDNRKELIAELAGVLKGDYTDVALVAAAFDQWGTDSFPKLIGDWSLAVWDPYDMQLTLASDFIGVRHLFYYRHSETIMWCNHLAPLALCGDQFTLCEEYVAAYIAFYPPAHLTPYREIRSVPPGKYVRIRQNSTDIHTYWSLNGRSETRHRTDAEYEQHYRHLFRQSVRRRLRTNSAVLAELSGGLDSTSIVCMADDIMAKEGAEIHGFDTFSFHDSNEVEDDDSDYYTKVEDKRGKIGFHADLRACGDSLAFSYPEFVATPGFGIRTEVQEALSLVLNKNAHRVILSGRGGDDVNGQGLDPRVQMADLLLEFRLFELAKQLTAWSYLIRKRPWIQLFFQTVLQLLPTPVRARLTPQGRLEPWVDRDFARKYRMAACQTQAVNGAWLQYPSRRFATETINTLSKQLTSAPTSAVEIRYPHLDRDLVEFLMTIPLEQLLRPGSRRCLMRRALADLLPQEVLLRKTKGGAGRCYCVALEKHWAEVERVFSPPLSSQLGFVNRERIYESLVAMKNRQMSPCFLRLIRALSLELWLRDGVARRVLSIGHSRAVPVSRTFAASSPKAALDETGLTGRVSDHSRWRSG